MLPEQPISFPEFVADQLLTADNLNELFHYLDVQERGTRVNLIGIGIVCGLELRVNAAGTEVTIGKGCGVTSQGYLVRWDEKSFQNYKPYDAAREIVYDPFYSGGAQRFDIDELKADASEEGITKLTPQYLDDKVALIFVELLREDAKNCDPESCDDKGRDITLSLRPLLVSRKDAIFLSGGLAGGSINQAWLSLPEMRMPRHHVPAEDIFDSGDVFEGFQQVLDADFLKGLQKNLTECYKRLGPLLQGRFPSNPFATLASDFAFISDGTISVTQLLYLQYLYDLFSDVIAAYDELRKTGMKLLSLCCPDENLFPRHLLLGPTGKAAFSVKVELRQTFIPSPALGCHGDLVGELRFLFQRLVLLLQRFDVPGSTESAFSRLNAAGALSRAIVRAPIRITPSKLGDFPLSDKAIPYYYNVVGGTETLLDFWNLRRSRNGTAIQNLSYHAPLYNKTDDAVLHPLQYDLEPFNFLRVEGHVGHSYTEALATINQIRDANRLPFDVVALSADVVSLREQLASIAAGTSKSALRENVQGELSMNCHFQDLEALYDTLAQGLLCNLCKEMKYYYVFPVRTSDQPTMLAPEVPLLKTCDPAFRFSSDSLGAAFEAFYKTLPPQYIQPEQFLSGAALGNATGLSNAATNNGTAILSYALLYYIEKLSEVLPTSLSGFSIAAFTDRYSDLMTVALRVKQVQQAAGGAAAGNDDELTLGIAEDIVDHLDALLYACKDAQFIALYNDYKLRWVYLAMLQKFGFYARLHPGFQHKAGVTMGGTFILVYHERSRIRATTPNIFLTDRTATIRAVQAETPPANTTTNTAGATTGKTQSPGKTQPAAKSATAQEKATVQDMKTDSTTKLVSDSIRRISVSKLRATLTPKQMSIIDKLFFKDLITRHNLDELTAQLLDKVVIADFFLPYMCCSDCPPIYYIVNETKDEEQPTISVKTTEYCSDDKASYPITVSPAGGTIFGEGTHSDNGVFSFHPSEVSVPEGALNKVVTLTYTVGEQSASVSVTVFAKPSAAFEVKPGTAYNVFLFESFSQHAASLAWDFGDGGTASGDFVTHLYQQDGVYTVTLKATNGVCSATATQVITVAKASISMDGKTFCSADQKSYPVTVSPAGGNLTGEGITANQETGTFTFSPSKIAFTEGQATRTITLSYALQGQTAQLTVTVSRTPTADFTVSDVPGVPANIKLFTPLNSFPAQYVWDFGDGGKSTETKPTHAFTKPGTYLVTLTATNSPCQSVITRDVQISDTKPTQKDCGPLEDIVALFDALPKLNPNQFEAFIELFQPYGEVQEFFGKLKSMVGKPVADQIAFFSESKIDALLSKWFEALNRLILDSNVRQTALALWRVLQELATYVMCIQNGDFDKNQINLGSLFGRLEEMIKGWGNVAKNMSKDEKTQLQFMLSDLKAEAANLKKNGEDTVKVQYLNKLNSLISMLTTYVK
jgi:PKD repeat protein